MLLRITISYFGGVQRDVLNFHRQELADAYKQRDGILHTFQDCVATGKTFYLGHDSAMLAYGPDLLRSSHFKFEIVEDEPA